MPPTLGLEYLIEYMMIAGPGMSGAMGMIPLDFCEINSWMQCSGLSLSGFECATIRDLSRAYVGQLNLSAKSPAPWVKGVEDIESYNLIKEIEEAKQAKLKEDSRTPAKRRLNKKR